MSISRALKIIIEKNWKTSHPLIQITRGTGVWILGFCAVTPLLSPLPPPSPPSPQKKKKWEFHHNPFHTLKAKINYHKSVLNGINRKATTSIQQKGQATNSPFAIKTNVHSTWKHSSCFLAQIRTKCSVSTPRLSVQRATMYKLPGQFTALASREQAPHTQLKIFYVQKEIAY